MSAAPPLQTPKVFGKPYRPVLHDKGLAARRQITADNGLARRRRLWSLLGWSVSGAALFVLGVAMSWIIGMILFSGVSALSLTIFIEPTQGNGGGLLNALEGTAVMAVGTLILAVPLGVAAGAYVAEFPNSFWARTIGFFSDTLVGVPSIVLGYAGYVILVQALGWSFSAAAACVTLAIMCLPYICRSTELAFAANSADLRKVGLRRRGKRTTGDAPRTLAGRNAWRAHRHLARAGHFRRRDRAAALHSWVVQLSLERTPFSYADRLPDLCDLDVDQRAPGFGECVGLCGGAARDEFRAPPQRRLPA